MTTVIRVKATKHSLYITAPQYKPYTETFAVAGRQNAVLDIKMESSRVPSRIRIEPNVQPARAAIDGKEVGEAPFEIDVTPGKHKYSVTSESYRTADGEVDVASGERTVVDVTLVPERTPLGIRFEPTFEVDFLMRGDTPFNNGVGDGQQYTEGNSVGAGGAVRAIYSINRASNFVAGLSFHYSDRPLDKIALGVTGDWCPDAVRAGWFRWCPTSATLLYYFPSSTGVFKGGQYGYKLGSKFEFRTGSLTYITAGVGYGIDTYTRSFNSTLTIGSVYTTVGAGLDL